MQKNIHTFKKFLQSTLIYLELKLKIFIVKKQNKPAAKPAVFEFIE